MSFTTSDVRISMFVEYYVTTIIRRLADFIILIKLSLHYNIASVISGLIDDTIILSMTYLHR